jgi:hypothetical protein
MQNPERRRKDLEGMIELEREVSRGDPDRETKAWLEKITEVDQERRGWLKIAAKGGPTAPTDEELTEALAELEETCRTAERELAAIGGWRERIEQLERDKDKVLDSYARMAPEALGSLAPEERHRLYCMLRLKIFVNLDRGLEVTGALEMGLVQSESVETETVPR